MPLLRTDGRTWKVDAFHNTRTRLKILTLTRFCFPILYKTNLNLDVKCPTFLSDFSHNWNLSTYFVKVPNTIFQENPPNGSHADTYGQTDGRPDATKLRRFSQFMRTRLKHTHYGAVGSLHLFLPHVSAIQNTSPPPSLIWSKAISVKYYSSSPFLSSLPGMQIERFCPPGFAVFFVITSYTTRLSEKKSILHEIYVLIFSSIYLKPFSTQ